MCERGYMQKDTSHLTERLRVRDTSTVSGRTSYDAAGEGVVNVSS
jgi:hypothetical protein